MHPYRDMPPPAIEPERPHEELVLYGALVAIGGLRVLVALFVDATIGAEVTVAALMVIAGIVGFTASRASRA
ncbi:MAG: hypothetical protein JO257_21580 [Deltaproteobacteria bacterium]|nr:hypothetical protein [Deltaproteobacteria bacterium]